MASYVASFPSPLAPPEAFAYMADLRNFARWDPGVREVTQIAGDGGGEGATFDVVLSSFGGRMTLRYVTTRYEEPELVRVQARSKLLSSIDTVEVRADGTGSVVTYHAELRLNGPWGALDVLLGPVFRRIGDRAADGLRDALGRQVAA